MSNDTLDEVLLQVPARSEYGRIVRVGAASLAIRVGLSFGEIDELRLTIDEAMILLVSAADLGTDINVAFRFNGTTLELEADCTTTNGLGTSELDRFVKIARELMDHHEIDPPRGWLLLRKTAAQV